MVRSGAGAGPWLGGISIFAAVALLACLASPALALTGGAPTPGGSPPAPPSHSGSPDPAPSAGNVALLAAKTWPRKNVITRAIGVFDAPELEMVQGRVEDGDLFVLCSDGLTEHVLDHEILSAATLRPLSRACDQLIATTLERGAKDNVTVITVSCREATQLQPRADAMDWDTA